MALRLRRGTDAERLAITPLEGELVYTTDTQKVFIGDGTTLGGNVISAFEMSDLSDVNTGGISTGDVLKWNGVSFVPGPDIEGNTGIIEGNTYFINVDGDLTGSVFGDDSTLLVDGVNGNIVGNVTGNILSDFVDVGEKNTDALIAAFTSTATNGLFPQSMLNISNIHDNSFSNELALYKSRGTRDNQTIVQTGDVLGSLAWAGNDGVIPAVAASIRAEVISVSASNIAADVIISARNGAFSTYTEALRIKADKGTVAQGYIQFGTYTTVERGNITPAAGMVIWNSTTTQFEGYDGTNWINLVDGVTSV